MPGPHVIANTLLHMLVAEFVTN